MSTIKDILLIAFALGTGMYLQVQLQERTFRRIARNAMQEIRKTRRWEEAMDRLYEDVQATPDEHEEQPEEGQAA
jgi:uncharacterized protein HemX